MDIHDPKNPRNAAGLREAIAEATSNIAGTAFARLDPVVVRLNTVTDPDAPGASDDLVVTRVEAIGGQVVVFIGPAPRPLSNTEIYDAFGDAFSKTHPQVEIDGKRYDILRTSHEDETVQLASKHTQEQRRVVLHAVEAQAAQAQPEEGR